MDWKLSWNPVKIILRPNIFLIYWKVPLSSNLMKLLDSVSTQERVSTFFPIMTCDSHSIQFTMYRARFEFAHRNPRAPPSSVSQDYVFVFKTACVNDIKDTVLAILDFLKGVSRQRSSALSASAKTSNKASDSKSVKGKTRPQTPPETIPTPSLTKATQVSKKSTNGTERPKPTSN